MMRWKARERLSGVVNGNGGAPAPAPAPQPSQQMMRLPRPGERPPSRFAAGVPDNVIEKFDAYARRAHGVITPYNERR